MSIVALIVFLFFFVVVTVMGFVAANWRRGDLSQLHEWGLAGGRFGTVLSWFMLGGDLYTAYTFVAVPGVMFSTGAYGFFAVPYTVILYPIVFIFIPKFWEVCKARGYLTASDYVKGKYDSPGLALAMAITGIVATMPYIALQIYGMGVAVSGLGINREIALVVAFLVLAAYTYVSGLRAPAMISLVKDAMVWIFVIVAIIVIPAKLGGFGQIFNAVAAAKKPLLLTGPQLSAYSTVVLGSGLALFLYPHVLTGVLSTNSKDVIRRNTAMLPAYSLLLGLLALLGFAAIAAGATSPNGPNYAIAALINKEFPDWFAGFAFAAISIGALVPAAIMSIGCANLFSRNIYRQYFKPNATPAEESGVAKLVSLIVKVGALAFVLFLPTNNVIDFQLLGGSWILQTLPAVFLSLFTRWFHRWALMAGWAIGMIVTTAMQATVGFAGTLYNIHFFGFAINTYAGFSALVLNVIVAAVLTPVFVGLGVGGGVDRTVAAEGATASA